MAQIPFGNFGQTVAQPGQAVSVPRLDVSSGMQAIGDTAQAINNDDAHRQLALDEKQRAARTALDLAKTTNQLYDVHDQISRGVADGSVSPDDADKLFNEQVTKIKGDALKSRSPDQQMAMDAHLTGVAGTMQRNIEGEVFKRKQQDTAATIDQFGEQVSREVPRLGPQWASEKFGAMVDFAGSEAGLNDAQKAKLKQSFTERAHASAFESAGINALTSNNDQALGELITKLQGKDGEPLDPAKRQQLTHQLYGWQQHILAKKAAAANADEQEAMRRHNEAVDEYNKATDIALGGGYLSPEYITELTTKGSGTDMAGPIANLIASQATIAGFATRSAEQRQAIINQLKADRATPGKGVDPLGDKLLTAVEGMDTKMREKAAQNPWSAAQQAGVIQDAATINPTDPSSALAIMQQRMQSIGKVEQWTGKKVSPLQPQEIEAVGKMVRGMPIDQAASLLANMGAQIGDADRIAAMAKQMHDKDGSLGLAMMYASDKTTQGRYTAELVLRGDQAISDKTVAVDGTKETGWRAQIAKQVRGTFSNREVEDNLIDAAFKIAAAKYVDNGSVDIESAIKLATGGIVERNGQKIPLPYGMSEDQLNQKIGSIHAADLAPQAGDGKVYAGRTPITLDQFIATLPKATLVHAGQGVYNVRAGTSLVTNSKGQRIMIKVAQ